MTAPVIDPTAPPTPLAPLLAAVERAAIVHALRHARGHRGHAAAALGLALRSLYNRIAAHPGLADEIAEMARAEGWPNAGEKARETMRDHDDHAAGSS